MKSHIFFHRVFLPNQCYNIIWYTYLLAIRTISSLLSPETATFSRGYSQVCQSVFKLFTCFSFSPEQMDTVAINLTKSDIMWMEFKFLNMKDHSFYQGMGGGYLLIFFIDKYSLNYLKIGWHFKIIEAIKVQISKLFGVYWKCFHDMTLLQT